MVVSRTVKKLKQTKPYKPPNDLADSKDFTVLALRLGGGRQKSLYFGAEIIGGNHG